jgi:uncharacterized protein
MIIPDLNLLVYAYDSTSAHHRAARAWWEKAVNGSEPVGLPRVVIFGFVRLVTSGRVFASPMTVDEAVSHLRAWMARPHVLEVEGGPDHLRKVLDLIRRAGTAGNLVTDAQIAAIAIEQGAVICTNDSDFRRFPDAKTLNPLLTK